MRPAFTSACRIWQRTGMRCCASWRPPAKSTPRSPLRRTATALLRGRGRSSARRAPSADSIRSSTRCSRTPCRTPSACNSGRGVLVTGSNMSGKSTFLRTVGVNAILAQTIDTCLARTYAAPVFVVRSCIGRSDDLVGGKSYYLAEVEALLALVEASDTTDCCLFLLDELFRGTNAVERIAAGEAVLSELLLDRPGHDKRTSCSRPHTTANSSICSATVRCLAFRRFTRAGRPRLRPSAAPGAGDEPERHRPAAPERRSGIAGRAGRRNLPTGSIASAA